jgi:hypothetical protein
VTVVVVMTVVRRILVGVSGRTIAIRGGRSIVGVNTGNGGKRKAQATHEETERMEVHALTDPPTLNVVTTLFALAGRTSPQATPLI